MTDNDTVGVTESFDPAALRAALTKAAQRRRKAERERERALNDIAPLLALAYQQRGQKGHLTWAEAMDLAKVTPRTAYKMLHEQGVDLDRGERPRAAKRQQRAQEVKVTINALRKLGTDQAKRIADDMERQQREELENDPV